MVQKRRISNGANQINGTLDDFRCIHKHCVRLKKSKYLPRSLQMDCSGGLAAQEVEKFSPPQEKWMKDAASSYSIVAALVATVTFAASITMLGSIYIDNGLPIFVKAFVVSNMFALSFSVASLLMFLCMLGQKILCPLLWKLMFCGVLTLFTSAMTMIPALLIVLGHKKPCLVIPVIVLYYVTAPFFFVLLILFIVRMIKSTYYPDIFCVLFSGINYLFALDLQQNSGGRRDDAAKSFGSKLTIYDPGMHTTHSLAQNSFEVLENPPTLETLAIYPKLMGKISDLWKFERGKNREEKPLVEFDSTNNSAHQSGLLVSNSEKINSREESKRRCMTERVLGSVDSTTRILSTDFDAADNSAHLVRPYQSGPVVSLLGNENRGEASKRECITKRILGLEDLQQNSGGRRDNAAKSFVAIYDPGIHTTHSLAQNSFEVVEALPTRKQRNDSVPLLSLGRLTLEGCVQEEKSQDLPRLMQIDGVEQRVTKSPRYLEGFTAQSTSSSRWPIGLPDGRHIVVLNLLEQSTKNVAHVAMADQFSPTVPLPKKKMVRRTLKRKYRIMNAIFLIHRQHFGKRCERTAKSFRAMRICRNHGINCVSMVKRIHKQHGINQWPFRQKWATRKGHSLGEKRPYEVSSLPMDLPQSLKLDCSGGLGAQSAIGLPDGGYILSISEKKIVGKTLKRKFKTMSLFSLEDDQQHGVKRWGDAANSLGRKHICRQLVVQHVSRAKRIHRLHVFHWWLFQQSATGSPYGGHIQSLLMKEIVREALKRKCRTSKWKDAMKNLGAMRIGRQLAIHRVSSRKHIIRPLAIHRSPFQQNWATLKVHCLGDERPVDHSQNERSRDQPEGCEGEIKNSTIEDLRPLVVFKRDYAVNQPEGRRIFSIDLEDLRQFISLRSADAVKELEALRMGRQLVIHCVSSLRHIIRTTMLICRPLVIHPLSSLELIIRPHAIHRLPFQQDPTLMEWYFSFKDERHFAAICLSMEGKLVSRLQLIHIRFGRCLPRPPLALLSSQLPFTSNITQLGGQDRSGSTASPSHNERTRDRPEGSKGKIRNLTIENLRSLGHLKRAEAAEVLGVSPATFKRHCRYLGIKEWPILPPKEVIIPPDQNGERNPSPMFITLSNNGQITTENEMGGQNLDQNTTHDSHRGHCGDVDIPFSAVYNEAEVAAGSGHCGDEHLPDSFDDPNFQSIRNGLIAEFENHYTIHDSHHGHCGDADVPFSAVYNGTEVAGGSGCFLGVFESSNFTFPGYFDAAAPIQPVPPILSPMPHPQIASIQFPRENMGSFEDHRNLLAPQKEPLAPSQAMPTTPITMESSECRRDTLTSVVGHLIGRQSVPTNPHTTPPLTERQDSTLVKVNATYGKHTIKLRLPLTSGITELKQVVSKQLKLGLDSFEVNYKDEHGEWILITLDEEVREHLQLTLSGNQVNKLWVVNKVPNTTDFCRNCECEMQII